MNEKQGNHTPEEDQVSATVETAEPTDAPAEEVLDQRDQLIEILTNERDGLKDQMIRAMAEAQNIQRRMRTQIEETRKFGPEGLLRELIPVLDNLSRSLDAAEKGANLDALLEGVRAVEKQMLKAFENAGAKRIEAEGQPFDPHLHEAVVTHPTDEVPEETVLNELESGFVFHDRVLRPAKVRVSQKP
ncbi:MAG: nucleotide exchange factor GrpE [Fimbriimonadaceae bacterium]|nr:nucleotide exchange factor GrpE [Armatimonadota bacterium]